MIIHRVSITFISSFVMAHWSSKLILDSYYRCWPDLYTDPLWPVVHTDPAWPSDLPGHYCRDLIVEKVDVAGRGWPGSVIDQNRVNVTRIRVPCCSTWPSGERWYRWWARQIRSRSRWAVWIFAGLGLFTSDCVSCRVRNLSVVVLLYFILGWPPQFLSMDWCCRTVLMGNFQII